jgi:cyclopropane fatty-acyl-phospholipid synthase-like methyltransferase
MTKRRFTDQKPRNDDRLLWNTFMGLPVCQAVVVAHDLKLFAALAEGPRSLAEISERLKLQPRAAEALLIACVAMGFVTATGKTYGLTQTAQDYLVPGRATYFGSVLDVAAIINGHLFSFESVRKAVVDNASQVYGGEKLFESHEEQAAQARAFTAMMHAHSMAPAMAWPDAVDLGRHRTMLDIGGGSAVHAMAAAARWPELRATTFDLPPICEIARDYITENGAADRVTTHAGDLWKDPYPAADLHFYADIFHDWPPERCRFLARKSFDALPAGGRLIVHEMLLDDDKAGPPAVAGYNVTMMLWTEGQQFSGAELVELLSEVGFVEVSARRTCGHWGIAIGLKPA